MTALLPTALLPATVRGVLILAVALLSSIAVDPGALHAQDSDDAGAPSEDGAKKPTRSWFEVVVGDERLGVIESQLETSGTQLLLSQKWISFPDGEETTIDLESRYRLEPSGPVPEKLVVTVSVDAVKLQGVVDFQRANDDDEVGSWTETYRSGEETPVKLRGPWSGESLLLPTSVPLLAPRLLDAPGERRVLYPAAPRSPSGPAIGVLGAPVYRLVRRPVEEGDVRTRFTLEGVDPSIDRRVTTCSFGADGSFVEAKWGENVTLRPIPYVDHARWLRENRPSQNPPRKR